MSINVTDEPSKTLLGAMELILYGHKDVLPPSASNYTDDNREVDRRARVRFRTINGSVPYVHSSKGVYEAESHERQRYVRNNDNQSFVHLNEDMENMVRHVQQRPIERRLPDVYSKQRLSKGTRWNQVLLLFWNRYHCGKVKKKWWHVQDAKVKHNCGECSCSFMYDRRIYQYVDAVLFDFNYALLNNSATSVDEDAPNLRLPSPRITEQYWILYNNEPAHNEKYYTRLHNSLRADVFNLSATYRNEADIVLNYGKCKPRNSSSSFKRSADNKEEKTGLVIWLVSNCNASSNRLEYARELQKFITLDIGGHCGDNDTQKIFGRRSFYTPFQSLNKYKFYLAFENTFCDQYISEKVFKVLDVESHVVPIVRGAGPYKGILPPGSYIDAADFSSPKHLAAYLHHLDKNDELYNEYFIARDKYICHNDYADGYSWPCAICNKVCNLKRKGTRETLDQDEIDQLYLPSNLCNYP